MAVWTPEYRRAYEKEYRDAHQDEHREYMRVYVEEHEKELRAKAIDRRYQKKHGWSKKGFDAAKEAQGNACDLCGETFSGDRAPHIDHDHTCCERRRSCAKCRRGLLCGTCNMALGLFKESPEFLNRAITYLAKYADKREGK